MLRRRLSILLLLLAGAVSSASLWLLPAPALGAEPSLDPGAGRQIAVEVETPDNPPSAPTRASKSMSTRSGGTSWGTPPTSPRSRSTP